MIDGLYCEVAFMSSVIVAMICGKSLLERTKSNLIEVAYAYFVSWIIFLGVQDGIWGMASKVARDYQQLFYSTSILYHVSVAIASILWMYFVLNYLELKYTNGIIFYGASALTLLTIVILLTANVWVPTIFWLDNEGMYHVGKVRGAVILLQHMVYGGTTLWCLWKLLTGKKENWKRYFHVILFSLAPAMGGYLRFRSPDRPYNTVAFMFTCLLIHRLYEDEMQNAQRELSAEEVKEEYTTQEFYVAPETLLPKKEIVHAEEKPISLQNTKKRVLLAEDNEMNQLLAGEILQYIGFDMELAQNGQEALDMVEREAPGYYDLVLMDIRMPIMDGYEATKRIRSMEEPGKRDIPILAMTANAFEEDKLEAKRAGMNGHISKPVDIEKLRKALMSYR